MRDFRSDPLVRAPGGGLASPGRDLLSRLGAVWSVSVFGTRAQVACTVGTAVTAVAALGIHRLLGAGVDAAPLALVAVLVQSWVSRSPLLMVVVAVALITQAMLVLGGDTQPLVGSRVVTLLTLAAAGRVVATRHASLLGHLERARRDAEQAVETAQDIASTDDLNAVFQRTLRRATDAVDSDHAGLLRVAGEDQMVVEAVLAPEGSVLTIGTAYPIDHLPGMAEAVRTAQPQVVTVEQMSPFFAAAVRRLGLRHMLAYPVTADGRIIGVLALGRRAASPFTSTDLQTLQPSISVAALLLRNALLLEDVRRAGRAKSSFLNLAAHELRTPLAVIRGYLSMLEDGTYPVSGQVRGEVVPILVAKAQELESLVEGLLLAARLDGGTLPCVAVELDVADVVRQAVARIGPRARLEAARITTRVPDDPPRVRADVSHVTRILDNLLNNALTYSPPPAELEVGIRIGRDVAIVVRDHGLGIPSERQPRIFDRFYRADDGDHRFIPGLGLGLSISRELARLNGGDLVLERSAPGEGSEFTLRLAGVRERPAQ